jgi:hypothetical protein
VAFGDINVGVDGNQDESRDLVENQAWAAEHLVLTSSNPEIFVGQPLDLLVF